jgi:excinuclease ABC subunit B
MAERGGEYRTDRKSPGIPRNELQRLVEELEKQMKQAAKDLEFEKAAGLRDQMYELRALLVEDSNLTPLQKMKYLTGEN